MQILKREMKLKGMSVDDLAERIKVSKTAIYLWLSSDFSPRAIYVKRMIDAGFSEDAALNPGKEV